ncbi:MAG: hypothetical protein KBE65_02385 [Phycisphaerae bacterium]|nr:hypothetical protein [Phycisphaerae bacterium]
MRLTRTMRIAVVCLASLCLLASCDTMVVYRHPSPGPGIGHGPPAHANAYGCRNKWVCGYELVFDDACGLYIVVGMTDWYYCNGYFYRWYGDVWQISPRADVWEPAGHDRLPPGLRMKARPVVAGPGSDPFRLNGNGNSAVKLNGNGNSLVKLNGNSDGHGNGKSFGRGRR